MKRESIILTSEQDFWNGIQRSNVAIAHNNLCEAVKPLIQWNKIDQWAKRSEQEMATTYQYKNDYLLL